jgi:diguanylate cyclase (GGDEF)-like protein
VVEAVQGQRGIGRVWIYEDVTEQRRIAGRLVELAERDPLTNLFNRRRFHEELTRHLADATRRGNLQVGLIAIDLDGFKPINDEFGHQAGDEVLVALAQQVGGLIRRNEMFFRLGGDEFGVLVPDATENELCELARRILEGIEALRFEFIGKQARITASLGIALFPRHANDAEQLIAAADQAMYRSKSSGRDRWTFAGS